MATIGILGGGAWGTALALTAARAGRSVRIWARDAATVSAIDARHENRRGAPGTLACFATDTSRLDELAPRFLGEPLDVFDLVDL